MKTRFKILAIVCILLLPVLYFVFRNSGKNTADSASVSPSTTPAPTPFDLVDWEDPAGFTLSYPSELVVNAHEENETDYAQYELTHPGEKGSLTVWVKDLPKGSTTLDEWIAKSPDAEGALVLDTTLQNKPAKKLVFSDTPKRIVTASVFEGVLFEIETILDSEQYWQAVTDAVLPTFEFVPLFTAPEEAAAPIQVDAEEVLE